MNTWTQVLNPLNNLGLSALTASIPILFLFYALAVARMKGHYAGLLTLVAANLVAVLAFGMPAGLSVYASLYGALVGLFPIGWIVITAIFLYRLTVVTGQFEVIRDSIAAVTGDRRLQALLIAFSFGAFLEGAAGFGAPVAITAAMLVGLGFNPLYAAGICLLANTVPVAFAAVGIPIITAGAVTGLDPFVIGQMVGRQIPILSLLVPVWLVFTMSGWKGTREVLPAVLVSGFSFALAQWWSANHLGPMLPNIIASVVSLISLAALLKIWQPIRVWRFPGEPAAVQEVKKRSAPELIRAWSPFVILTVLIADWGMAGVKQLLERVTVNIPVAGLDGAIVAGGVPMAVVFKFNWLSVAGTSILITAVITALILGVSPRRFFAVFLATLKDLRHALITISSMLGYAYVANYSGMTPTLGLAFTVTGGLFPFVSAFLGWLGVLITGSDTSSNALFGKMQQVTAESMGINPVLTVATNSSGGVAGKMISPQSIAVATAACGLAGREGDLFRFTLPRSIFFTALIGIIAMVQAYVFPWVMPAAAKAAAPAAGASRGGVELLAGSGIFILILAIYANLQRNSHEERPLN